MEDDEIEFKEMKWDNTDSIEQSILLFILKQIYLKKEYLLYKVITDI